MKITKSAVILLLIALYISYAHSVDYYLSDEYGCFLSKYQSESNLWVNGKEIESEMRIFIETALIPVEMVFGNDVFGYAGKGKRYSYQLEEGDIEAMLDEDFYKDKNKVLIRGALETARFEFTHILIGDNENVVIFTIQFYWDDLYYKLTATSLGTVLFNGKDGIF